MTSLQQQMENVLQILTQQSQASTDRIERMEGAGNTLQQQVQVETQRLQTLQDQIRNAADTRIAALGMSVARGETAVSTWNAMLQTMEARINQYNDNLNQNLRNEFQAQWQKISQLEGDRDQLRAELNNIGVNIPVIGSGTT